MLQGRRRREILFIRCLCVHTFQVLFCISLGSRSIAFDGQYVYVTSSSLKSLLKVGTGKQGTVRGMVYVSREMEEPGWVVWLGGSLLQRRETANKEEEGEEEFCTILDSNILEVCFLSWGWGDSNFSLCYCLLLSTLMLVACSGKVF